MVNYSAILNRQAVISHISQYFDNIEETDFIENLDNLKLNANDFLKLKYVNKCGIKIICLIKRADKRKYALTETIN
jgi:hypothetical protein